MKIIIYFKYNIISRELNLHPILFYFGKLLEIKQQNP